jgi:hypothetical protein
VSGYSALSFNTTGSNNTAHGNQALESNLTGSFNIAIGSGAGFLVGGGNSNNIHIGNDGVSTDGAGTNNGVIRIGKAGVQTTTFIAGISGVTSSGGIEVFVNSSGQLGTSNSSRRFKEQITDMGDSSSKLKPEYDDGSHLLQYGLIAEEVAKVYPEMVAYGSDGQILTVKYQLLAPMLLNEAQKQNQRIEKLEEELAALRELLAARPAGGQ